VKLIHSWSYYSGHIPWSIVFYYSSTYTLASSIRSSNLLGRIVDLFVSICNFPPTIFSVLSGVVCLVVTQIFLFPAVCTSIAHAAGVALARKGRISIVEALMSISLYCGFSFCLPTSSGANYIVLNHCNMKRFDMLRAGLGCCLISFGISSFLFLTLTHLILYGSL